MQPRSLVQQYEALDLATKQAFNEAFLRNLETVKLSVKQHAPGKEAINSIFPPQEFGFEKDIENLIEKYAGNYRRGGEELNRRVSHGEAADLKTEMAQAIKDIKLINQELAEESVEESLEKSVVQNVQV